MAKKSIQFVCENCGAQHSKWAGKCDSCSEWNTLIEQIPTDSIRKSGNTLKPTKLSDVDSKKQFKRIESGITDIDKLLGGGFVSGGVHLVAGQPGIGKSTLLLQIAANVAKNNKVLYVTGEESLAQIQLRAKRLEVDQSIIEVSSSTSANNVAATITSGSYDLVVIDSIQTMHLDEVQSAAGSVSQVTNSAAVLSSAAKASNVVLLLVGHVTKQGSIAGPKILEHLVDVVINFEGDRYGGFKTIRGIKNRYGSTNDAALFEMKESGLEPIENPSKALLQERQVADGSVVLATMEGTRPILVEVQALVSTTHFGYPKRAVNGIDLNRLNVLIAMLSRRTKLNLADKDVYINVIGGMRITDPAADLAVCMAIASASKGMQLKDDAVVFGEVGLSGEVRHVTHSEKRIAEAKKLGFSYAIGPKASAGNYLKPVATVKDALNKYLSKD